MVDVQERARAAAISDPWTVVESGRPIQWDVVALLGTVVLSAGAVVGHLFRTRPADGGTFALAGWAVVVTTALALAIPRRAASAPRWAVAGVVAVAGFAVAGLTFGRLAAAFVVLLLVIGRPVAADLARREDHDGAALGAPFLAAAALGWLRDGAGLGVGVALLLALVVVVAAVVAPRRTGALSGAVRRGAVGLSRAIALLLTGLVLAPIVYTPSLVVGVVRRLRHPGGDWARPGSRWSARATSREDDLRDGRYPFASTPPRVRLRRHLASLATVGCLVAAGVAIAHRSPTSAVDGHMVGFGQVSPNPVVFPPRPWLGPMLDEFNRFGPTALPLGTERGWYLGPFHGTYLNTADQERRTLQSSCAGCPRTRVWLVGGSAVWGSYQRDDHTIASALVRFGDAAGRRLEVHNLGVPGYTVWQEYQLVRDRLATGVAKPDAIVFYDGFNDVLMGAVLALQGKLTAAQPIRSPTSNFDWIRLLLRPDPFRAAGGVDRFSAVLAEHYRSVEDRIRALAHTHGIDVAFAFQPSAFVDKTQSASVDLVGLGSIKDQGTADGFIAQMRAAFAEIGSRLAPDVVDLTDVFAGRAPVFADSVHTNEAGAELVARRLYPLLPAMP